MSDKWLYFGCNREPGHYLYTEGMLPNFVVKFRRLGMFDGLLAPQQSSAPYIASVTRLGGWGFTALSFWDYSVDKRGGCNSIIFAPSLVITPEELLRVAEIRFPEVWARLPQPVVLVSI
jgi:hypothetical protein